MSQNAQIPLCPPTASRTSNRTRFTIFAITGLFCLASTVKVATQSAARDPGVRGGPPGAGGFIAGLTPNQQGFFTDGLADFNEIDSVKGTVPGTGFGLGPGFNAESCAQCHAAPAVGGSSPAINPQVTVAIDQGAANQIPPFITTNGPVREVRFPLTSDLRHPDGGVHDVFTIAGRGDAPAATPNSPTFSRRSLRTTSSFAFRRRYTVAD